MSSLRENIETSFAAAAFAERDLGQEALAVMNAQGQAKTAAAQKRESKPARQRPSLKA